MGRRQKSRDRVRAERARPHLSRDANPPVSEPSIPSSSSPAPSASASERRASRRDAGALGANEEFSPAETATPVPSPAVERPPPMDPEELELPDELELSDELEVRDGPAPSGEAALDPASEPEGPASPVVEARLTLDRGDAVAAVETEIAAAIAEGDARRALILCAEVHAESVGRLCLALLGSQTEADEVTEEVLLEAHGRPGELGAQRSLRGWLLRLARRACVRRLERRPQRRRNGADEPPPSSERPAAARARHARALLARVRPSEREALALRFAADASTLDVAIACEIEPSEAQRRVSRALARLRDTLENETSDD